LIRVTRLNGQQITLNAEIIECVEACPDTVISLATNNRYLVKESVDEVVEKVIEYRKRVNSEKPVPNPIQGFKRE
jgi:flagellar protein FlbD